MSTYLKTSDTFCRRVADSDICFKPVARTRFGHHDKRKAGGSGWRSSGGIRLPDNTTIHIGLNGACPHSACVRYRKCVIVGGIGNCVFRRASSCHVFELMPFSFLLRLMNDIFMLCLNCAEVRLFRAPKENRPERFRAKASFLLSNSGSPTWTRTRDLRINSPSLYQLSYQGKEALL